MEQNNFNSHTLPTGVVDFLRRPQSLAVVLLTAGMAAAGDRIEQTRFTERLLNGGDMVYADSFGAVMKVDAATRQVSVLASNGYLVMPYGVAQDRQGNLLVTDAGADAIVHINAKTGQQTMVSKGGALGVPFGIAVDRRGTIYVANGQTVVKLDGNGVPTPLAKSDSSLRAPLGVTVGPDGNLYIADAVAGVFRLDPRTGNETNLIEMSGACLMGIAVDSAFTVHVTDLANHTVHSFSAVPGAASVVQQSFVANTNLVSPLGIALDGNGNPFVADPDAMNLAGAIFGPDSQDPVVTGGGNYVNPRGLTIITR